MGNRRDEECIIIRDVDWVTYNIIPFLRIYWVYRRVGVSAKNSYDAASFFREIANGMPLFGSPYTVRDEVIICRYVPNARPIA